MQNSVMLFIVNIILIRIEGQCEKHNMHNIVFDEKNMPVRFSPERKLEVLIGKIWSTCKMIS